MYAVKQVIYRNFSPETFKNSAILQTFASLPEKKFHESGIRHAIFRGSYILAEGFFRIWFCPHSIIPSNLKSARLGPWDFIQSYLNHLSFVFVFVFVFLGGKPKELKKHKLNKIKGKCKKKKILFCHDVSLHPHTTTTDEPQAGSLVPVSHGVRCNSFWHNIQDGGSISWVQSVWRATTTSSRYDNRHFNPCSQLPYFSFQNITCSILVFFSFRTGVFELVRSNHF